MNTSYIECAVENFTEALVAEKKGANKIELCENLANSGVTPSYGSIKKCIDKLNIPLSVLIRPRTGNFVYNNDELDIILEDIKICNKLKPAFVVVGLLNSNNTINYSQMKKVIDTSKVPVVMHRAFDEVAFNYLEVKNLANIGISGILSAGGKSTFFDGLNNLKKILAECNKYNVKLIAAGKITNSKLLEARDCLNPYAFHGKDIL